MKLNKNETKRREMDKIFAILMKAAKLPRDEQDLYIRAKGVVSGGIYLRKRP
jgi:hypothetical protein